MERVPACRKRLLLLWGQSHRKKDCPRRTTEGAHGQRIEVQSQQQSVTVNRPIRSTQSGTSATRGRPRNQEGRTQDRVYHMT